jgi:hypothetical protein
MVGMDPWGKRESKSYHILGATLHPLLHLILIAAFWGK